MEFLFLLYALPLMIAGARSHPNTLPIGVINILLGWTVLGWIMTLAWSLSAKKQ